MTRSMSEHVTECGTEKIQTLVTFSHVFFFLFFPLFSVFVLSCGHKQDDLAAMGAIRFRFLEKTNPTGAVQTIASALGEDGADPAEVRESWASLILTLWAWVSTYLVPHMKNRKKQRL